MGHQFKQHFHPRHQEQGSIYTPPPHGTCRVQVVRSVSDWSHGVLKENSIQNACSYFAKVSDRALTVWIFLDRQLIGEAEHYIYIGMLCNSSRPGWFLTFPPRESILV